MKNIDDLIESAAEFAERGLSKGEIADELNVSRETASWLVQRAGAATGRPEERPDDIHVDWSAIGRDSNRLAHVGAALADLIRSHNPEADLTIGIEKAGVPLATMVAHETETDIGTYTPRKHQWEEGDIEELGGSFSRNFAQIEGRDCYIVDDTITSGTTLTETIRAVKSEGGNPVSCAVLVDKQGLDEIEGVPVQSLVGVLRVDEA